MAKAKFSKENPIEIWALPDGSWEWRVLRKYTRSAAADDKPYARWFCFVSSPFVGAYPEGEYGDVYVSEIKGSARKVA